MSGSRSASIELAEVAILGRLHSLLNRRKRSRAYHCFLEGLATHAVAPTVRATTDDARVDGGAGIVVATAGYTRPHSAAEAICSRWGAR
jgi:hypothetical protein